MLISNVNSTANKFNTNLNDMMANSNANQSAASWINSVTDSSESFSASNAYSSEFAEFNYWK